MSARVISEDLADILDRLVAIDLDLNGACGPVETSPQVAASGTIAGACVVLRSAIADLRDIVHQIDGASYLAPAASARRKRT